ncbi:MAG: hypothetical protein WCF18_08935 [Chthoniobacteraceae bacterium]
MLRGVVAERQLSRGLLLRSELGPRGVALRGQSVRAALKFRQVCLALLKESAHLFDLAVLRPQTFERLTRFVEFALYRLSARRVLRETGLRRRQLGFHAVELLQGHRGALGLALQPIAGEAHRGQRDLSSREFMTQFVELLFQPDSFIRRPRRAARSFLQRRNASGQKLARRFRTGELRAERLIFRAKALFAGGSGS